MMPSINYANRLRYGFVAMLLLAASAVAAAPATAQVQINNLVLTERSDGQGYVLRIRSNQRIQAFSMPEEEGARVDWTIYDANIGDGVTLPTQGPIAQFDVSKDGDHLTLHLQMDGDRSIETDAYRDSASDDILMNLTYTDPASTADASPEPGTTTGDGAQPGNNAVDSVRERWRLDTIVIDPGHGGKDTGATAHGVKEKDIVLDVALQLGEYLERYLDVNVLYTRTDDTFVELEERGRFANENGAKLFLSIHANAAASHRAHGTETFFLGPYKSESARRVMERENSVIRYEEDTDVYDDYNDQQLVRATLTQSAYLRQSQQLASLIEDQFENRVNRRSRGVKQAPFYVLWGASMPAVLVEMGFLSNRSEARFLASDQGKTYMASAIFRAVRDYKEQYERGMVPVAGE